MRTLFRTLEERQRFFTITSCSSAIILVTMLLNLLFLTSDVGFKDQAGFIYRSVNWGILHPTGYPSFLMLGKLFSWLPVGDIPMRINFVASLFSALTACMMFLFFNQVAYHPYAAFTTVVTFSLGQTYLRSSVSADVYTLNTFLIMTILVLWRWSFREPTAQKLYLTMFVIGLSLTNHATVVFILPCLLLSLFLEKGTKPLGLGRHLFSLAFLLLPLVSYLFVIRYFPGSAYDNGAPLPTGLVDFLSAKPFRHMLFMFSPEQLIERVAVYMYFLLRDYTFIVPILAVVGMVVSVLTIPELLPPLLVFYLLQVGFALNYGVEDVAVFFIPSYLVLVIFMGLTFQLTLDSLKKLNSYAWAAVIVLPGFLPLFLATRSFALVTNYGSSGEEHARRLLAALPQDATFLYRERWLDVWSLRYVNDVERWRPDVKLVPYRDGEDYSELFAQPNLFIESAEFADKYNAVVSRVSGENVSDRIAKWVDGLFPSTVVLLAEKNEYGRILEEKALKAFEKLGIPRESFADDQQFLVGIGVKDAPERSALVAMSSTFASLTHRRNEILPALNRATFTDIDLKATSFTMGNFAQILVGGTEFSPNKRGINVATLLPGGGANVDTASIRTFDTYQRDMYPVYGIVGTVGEKGFTPKPTFFEQTRNREFVLDYRSIKAGESDNDHFFLYGWGSPERDKRWATAKVSYLACRFTEVLPQMLTVRTHSFKSSEQQSCEVRFNGEFLGSYTYPPQSNETIEVSFTFPPHHIRKDINVFSFHFSYAKSPQSLGLGVDTRTLAAAFEEFTVGAPPSE